MANQQNDGATSINLDQAESFDVLVADEGGSTAAASSQAADDAMNVVMMSADSQPKDEGYEVAEAYFGSHVHYSCQLKDGEWICQPYKRERIAQQVLDNSPGTERRVALIETLKDMNVKVYIVDGESIKTTKDILTHIKRVVGWVAKENRILDRTGPLGFQRCLLYQDPQGRLFNLLMCKHSVGPAAKWQDYLDTFSGLEAMIALTVLSRSFPCAMEDLIGSLKPAYLSLVLGLVLTEEISLSWVNASMLVRAMPSISAHSMTSKIGSDWLRKVIVLCLAMAAAATGTIQTILTLIGIGGASIVLLSNLGSRSWHFLKWKPIRYQGPGASVVAYLSSIAAGMAVPYMAHREIEIGGKAAMEHVIKTAFIVAVIFVVSDIDVVQQFLIVGSEACNQDTVNIVVGSWWAFSLFISMFLVRRIPYKDFHPVYDGEPLLVEDHASPVGYKVPSIPDFEIDPSLFNTGKICLPLNVMFIVGMFMAFGIGGAIVYLAFTSWDEEFFDGVETLARDIL